MKKAKNLVDALNIFDPEKPLRTIDELKRFFIEREKSPREELELFLKHTKEMTPKVLFTGHRGSGKSTELAKLTLNLEKQFFIVNYSVKRAINLFDIKYVDVLLSLATELFKTASEQKIKIKKSLMEDILLWFKKDVTRESTIEDKDVVEVEGAISAFFAKLQSKLGTESSTRTTIRERVEPRLYELLERVDLIVKEVEQQTERRVLIIIEDLDKADLSSAKEIFCGHSMSLTQPQCCIIYTFPIALRHDNDFINMCQNFDEPSVLPSFKIVHRDGTIDEKGKAELIQLIENRAETSLFAPAALEMLVKMSGGLPRELINLARRACLIGMRSGKTMIDESTMKEAANRLRNDYQVLLTSHQLETLKQVHRNKRVENDETHRALLHNLSVLEYRNDDLWHDVHPVVQTLLND
jgi:hypothetical protein